MTTLEQFLALEYRLQKDLNYRETETMVLVREQIAKLNNLTKKGERANENQDNQKSCGEESRRSSSENKKSCDQNRKQI